MIISYCQREGNRMRYRYAQIVCGKRRILWCAVLTAFFLLFIPSARAEILLPEGTQCIEVEAFYGDTSLCSVFVPEGVERIESKAFANCDLTDAYLPDSLSYIAPDAFDGNPWLTIHCEASSPALNWAYQNGVYCEVDFFTAVTPCWTDYYRISWEPMPGAYDYAVSWSKDSGCVVREGRFTPENDSDGYVNIFTEPGVQCYFVIEYKKDGAAYRSPVLTAEHIRPISAPDSVWSEVDADGNLTLEWSPVPGATGYRVYQSNAPDWTIDTYWSVPEAGCSFSKAMAEGEEYFWVCAFDDNGPGLRQTHSAVYARPLPEKPTGLSVYVNEENRKVHLSWEPADHAEKYIVYYSYTDLVWSEETENFEIWDPACEYIIAHYREPVYMWVRGENQKGKGPLSDRCTIYSENAGLLKTPEIYDLEFTDNDLCITASLVEYADWYRVTYQSVDEDEPHYVTFDLHNSSIQTEGDRIKLYLENRFDPSTVYSVQLFAVRDSSSSSPVSFSEESDPVYGVTMNEAPAGPRITSVVWDGLGVLAEWIPVADAEGYIISLKNPQGSTFDRPLYEVYVGPENSSLRISNACVPADIGSLWCEVYSYKEGCARGFNGTTWGINAPQQIRLTAPEITSLYQWGTQRIVVTWDLVDGATSYHVYFSSTPSRDGAAVQTYGSQMNTAYYRVGYDEPYWVWVEAVYSLNGQILDQAVSDAAFLRTVEKPAMTVVTPEPTPDPRVYGREGYLLSIPANVVASASGTEIFVAWDLVDGATRYDVYYSTYADGRDTRCASAGRHCYTRITAGLAAWCDYYVWVRAVLESGGIIEDSSESPHYLVITGSAPTSGPSATPTPKPTPAPTGAATVSGALTQTVYTVSTDGQTPLQGYVQVEGGTLGRVSVSVLYGSDRAITVSYEAGGPDYVDLSAALAFIPASNVNLATPGDYSVTVWAKAYGSEDAVKIGSATVRVVGAAEPEPTPAPAPDEPARIADVLFWTSTVNGRKRYAHSGYRDDFVVKTTGAIDAVAVYVDDELCADTQLTRIGENKYALTHVYLPLGIHTVKFALPGSEQTIRSEFAVYQPCSGAMYVGADAAPFVKWPAAGEGASMTLSLNDPVTVSGELGDYWYVSLGGSTGWIHKDYLTEEHMHSYTVFVRRENEAYTFYNANMHYLSSYDEVWACECCGLEGSVITREFTRESASELSEHDWNNVICSKCHCNTQGENAFIHLTIHVPEYLRLCPGDTYDITATWEPSYITENQLLLDWGVNPDNEKDSLWPLENEYAELSYPNANQEYGAAVRLRAKKPGTFRLAVASDSYSNVYSVITLEITNEYLDEDAYFRTLAAIRPGENPMENKTIYNTIYQEYTRCFSDSSLAEKIAKRIKAAPYPYRDLLLWSFFDYTRKYDTTIDNSYTKHSSIYLQDKNLSTLFHETGHAIDSSLNGANYCTSSRYKTNLYNKLRKPIENIVRAQVRESSEGYCLSSEEIESLVYAIMHPECCLVMFNGFIKNIRELNGGYTIAQQAVFYLTINELSIPSLGQEIYMELREIHNSYMYLDMLAGFTNQVATGLGHGPLLSAKQEFYWFTERTHQPTYMQNIEAWAEYFSSRILGNDNLNRNRNAFPEACALMDQMAEGLLSAYRAKHQ